MVRNINKYSRSYSIRADKNICKSLLIQLKNKDTLYNIIDIIANKSVLGTALNNIKDVDTNIYNNLSKYNKYIDILIEDIKTGKVLGENKDPRDQIVIEAIRMVLDAIYDSKFQESSHGNREGYTYHTALEYIRLRFGERRWFIECNMSTSYKNFNYSRVISIIENTIKDKQFIELLNKCIIAGYMSFTTSRLSGIINNIYLDYLDRYMEVYIDKFNKGESKKRNPEYGYRMYNEDNKNMTPKERLQYVHSKNIYSTIETDDGFRRMSYVRYGDEILIGIIASIKESYKIKEDLETFITEKLHINLDKDKCKVINAIEDRANFLNYEIHITPLNKRPKRKVKRGDIKVVSQLYVRPLLSSPISKILHKLKLYGYTITKRDGVVVGRLIHKSNEYIIQHYNELWENIADYYYKATNFHRLSIVHHIITQSCMLTLARKNNLNSKREVRKAFGIPVKAFEKPSGRKSNINKFEFL